MKWQLRCLSDLLQSLESGGRPKGGGSFDRNGVVSIGGEHIGSDGQLRLESLKYVPSQFYESLNQGKVRRGDILVVKDGATTGKTAFVSDEFPFAEAAVNEHVTILRVNSSVLHPKYAFYWLFGPEGNTQILSDFRGSAQGGITRGFVRMVKIPLPPLSEQRRIVEILDQADALRRKRAEADARAARILPALFYQMFGDPATNPMGWPIERIGKFAEVRYGLSDRIDTTTTADQGVRIITISNITLDGSLDTSVERYSLASQSDRAKAQVKKGDLLFNWRNGSQEHIGKTALWEEQLTGEILHVSFLLKIRTNPDSVSSYYLWTLLNLLLASGFFKRASRTQINTKFNASEESVLQLPLPPLPLQRAFAAQVVEVRKLKSEQATSSYHLDDLFQALLHRAFSGELTARWREAHIQELLSEMEHQAGTLVQKGGPRKA